MEITVEIGRRGGTRGRVFDSSVATRTLCFEPGVSTRLTSVYRRSPQTASNHTALPSPGSAPADTASTLLYQHSDHLTTRVTTDNAGTLSNQQAHYPYGEKWYATGTADPSVKRKFTSYLKETDSSLNSGQINYAIARYHGARTGRFNMADPNQGFVGNPQRLNRYAYVLGDATNRSDPSGLDQCEMPLDVFLIYNLPWVGLGDEPPPIVNPYAFGGGPGYCYGGVTSAPSGPLCVSPQVPVMTFTGGPARPPTSILGCGAPQGSATKCVAKLMYPKVGVILVQIATLGCGSHAFWNVKDRTGAKHHATAGPTRDGKCGGQYGCLNAWQVPGWAKGKRWFKQEGPADTCDSVDRLLSATRSFPNDTIKYDPAGPNSNSVARYLGQTSGLLFGGIKGPPCAIGWDKPVP